MKETAMLCYSHTDLNTLELLGSPNPGELLIFHCHRVVVVDRVVSCVCVCASVHVSIHPRLNLDSSTRNIIKLRTDTAEAI